VKVHLFFSLSLFVRLHRPLVSTYLVACTRVSLLDIEHFFEYTVYRPDDAVSILMGESSDNSHHLLPICA